MMRAAGETMRYRHPGVVVVVAAVIGTAVTVRAQEWKTKSPTTAEWTAMAKLPDFNGVWEAGRAPAAAPAAAASGAGAAGRAGAPAAGAPRAGGGGRAGGGAPGGPQLTPAYAAKRQELASRGAEDND